MTAPAAMPSEREISGIIIDGMDDLRVDIHFDIDNKEQVADWAAAKIAALFAPILAAALFASRHETDLCQQALTDRAAMEAALEKAELVLCDLMNAAGHYKATHSEIDREALSATIKKAAELVEAAAIRAQGE